MSPLLAMANRPDGRNAQQRKANRRLALVLASVALVFFLGFMAKMVLLGR